MNIQDLALLFLANEKLGLFFSAEKKTAILQFADWASKFWTCLNCGDLHEGEIRICGCGWERPE